MATTVLGVRLKEEDKKILQREAKRNGMTLSDYIRNLARLRVDLKMTINNLKESK
jgi:uncharacterized protein (DUF1778 family)